MRLALLAGMDPRHTRRVVPTSWLASQYFRGQPDGPAFVLVACASMAAAERRATRRRILFQTIADLAYGTRTPARTRSWPGAVCGSSGPAGRSKTQAIFDDPNNEADDEVRARPTSGQDAVRTARDVRKPDEVRVAAIRDLPILPFREADPGPGRHPPGDPAAGRPGGDARGPRHDSATTGCRRIILAAWPAMTPQVRATATEVC